jgi:cell wall-associated NlpC family hydrolase
MRGAGFVFTAVVLATSFGACGTLGRDDATGAPGWATPASSGPDSRCERRLGDPDRTVIERPCGTLLAILTDGAFTARVHGATRTFNEPSAAAAVQTDDWVRALPARFDGTVNEATRSWLLRAADDESPDLLAMAMQYIDGAPVVRDGTRQIAGDAGYGPLSATGTRIEGSDFYDYLGTVWTFSDGAVEKPLASELGSLDCSGYMRMLWGVRAGLPLASTAAVPSVNALPRRAVQMEAGPFGIPIAIAAPPAEATGLQAGDLVFFDADPEDGPAIDHVGMYLGRDANGGRRFISSRKGANGPTLGDVRGASILDGPGLYAKAFRSARRL